MNKTLSIYAFCLVLCSGLLAAANAQQPQPAQQEKRIALVVGNGAYAKSPLATAANDAGLIAQTLQAAGFDVVGARDLDGDTLRKSFRDFFQKAEASGPGTVAMVYLAGYGVQLAGENYFIPVDSALNRDTDIPIEGLRVSDYLRQLAALPLKAGIVVLDAARQQPFIEGGQPIASGLALVEPDPRMLVAFNAAPGTVAPPEQGPYGIYAQSLAEMIRTGGLPLPEVFDRVRLRVNDAGKGAQVPWNAGKVDAPFMFFDRAPDAPPQAPPDQTASMRDRPIRDLGAQDAYAAALDRDTMQGYEDFLSAYPGDPLARRVRAIVAARREAITWLRTYRADTPQAYWSYLRRYPRGPHAGDARRRLAILTAPLEPPPSFVVMDYDIPPPPPDEIIYVDRPVLMFGDPEFDFLPPPPPPVFFLPPPPPDFIVLAPPFAPIGLFILPQPYFVPIPVYYRAPLYVVPPRNNFIFANIHNREVINTVINRPPPPMPRGPGGVVLPPPSGAKGRPGFGGANPIVTGPALPPSVAQKASLIQQGKLPVPPSASINPGRFDRRGGPNAPLPANTGPNALPQTQTLPKTNALPLPGSKGGPQLAPGAAGRLPGGRNPDARLAPQIQPGTGNANSQPAGGPAGTELRGRKSLGGSANTGGSPPPPEIKRIAPDTRRPNLHSSEPSRAPLPQVAPRPQPEFRRSEPPRRMEAPRPAPQVMRSPPPPPPRISAPPPPPRPAPQMQMVRPAPQMARPAPPPPRPAGPPPGGGGKKCPPNVPRC